MAVRPKRYADSDADWREQEERAVGAAGGRRHRGSGSSDYLKGDGSTQDPDDPLEGGFLIESKTTFKYKSRRIEAKELNKLSKEALAVCKDPAFLLTFQQGIAATTPRDWIMVPVEVFRRQQDELNELKKRLDKRA